MLCPRTDGVASPEQRRSLADRLEHALHAVLDAWFPRSIDSEHGGFLTDFDFKWRPRGSHDKGIEFQGRTTWLLAHVAMAYPEQPRYREMADHGFRFLRDVMWDEEHGGWFRLVDREGHAGEAGTKHGHGMSYALAACAAHHRLTADPESLALAEKAFSWIDRHAHDDEHGGYYGPLLRDGTWMKTAAQNPVDGSHRDVIGTPLGCKDANTLSDLLRSFVELDAVWPDAHLLDRIREAVAVVRDRFVTAQGAMHMFMMPDWTPVPDFARYLQTLHSSNHLRAGMRALGLEGDEHTSRVLKSMVDLVLLHGWDAKRGGFFLGGSTFGPTYLAGRSIFIDHKSWWGQAEGLTALLELALAYPEDERCYDRRFAELWSYIEQHLVDSRYGGWLSAGTDVAPEARKGPKASQWRDCSHEGLALLACIGALRR